MWVGTLIITNKIIKMSFLVTLLSSHWLELLLVISSVVFLASIPYIVSVFKRQWRLQKCLKALPSSDKTDAHWLFGLGPLVMAVVSCVIFFYFVVLAVNQDDEVWRVS